MGVTWTQAHTLYWGGRWHFAASEATAQLLLACLSQWFNISSYLFFMLSEQTLKTWQKAHTVVLFPYLLLASSALSVSAHSWQPHLTTFFWSVSALGAHRVSLDNFNRSGPLPGVHILHSWMSMLYLLAHSPTTSSHKFRKRLQWLLDYSLLQNLHALYSSCWFNGTSLAGCIPSEHIYHYPYAFLENISPSVKPKILHLEEAEHGSLTPLFSPPRSVAACPPAIICGAIIIQRNDFSCTRAV